MAGPERRQFICSTKNKRQSGDWRTTGAVADPNLGGLKLQVRHCIEWRCVNGVGFRSLQCGGVGGDLATAAAACPEPESLVGPVDPHNRLVHYLRQRDDAVAAQTLQAFRNYRAFANGFGTPYILQPSSSRRVRVVAIRHKLRGLKLQTIEDRRPRIEDRGQSIFDSRSSIFDHRFTVLRLR
jgi:hypothetical protein